MGVIQNILKGIGGNRKEFKQKFKAAQEEDRINNMIEERKLSANARELKRYIQEKNEEKIKVELDKIHHQRNKENWKSKNMVLKQDYSLLKNDRPILKEKNIFLDHKSTNVVTGKRLYFK